MEKTDWFPGEVKPVHVGVYETWSDEPFPWFQFWNGRFWGWAGISVEDAMIRKEIMSCHQRDAWRGLTEPAA